MSWMVVIVSVYTVKYHKTDNSVYSGDKKPSSIRAVWTEGGEVSELIMTTMLNCISEVPQILCQMTWLRGFTSDKL